MTRKVYAVIDSGGEWEDAWEIIVRVFASERLARECVRKRIERNRDMDDYVTTRVEAVDFVEVRE